MPPKYKFGMMRSHWFVRTMFFGVNVGASLSDVTGGGGTESVILFSVQFLFKFHNKLISSSFIFLNIIPQKSVCVCIYVYT